MGGGAVHVRAEVSPSSIVCRVVTALARALLGLAFFKFDGFVADLRDALGHGHLPGDYARGGQR